jgi:hypothetical protein
VQEEPHHVFSGTSDFSDPSAWAAMAGGSFCSANLSITGQYLWWRDWESYAVHKVHTFFLFNPFHFLFLIFFFIIIYSIFYSHHLKHLHFPIGHSCLRSQVMSILPSQLAPPSFLPHQLPPLLSLPHYLFQAVLTTISINLCISSIHLIFHFFLFL